MISQETGLRGSAQNYGGRDKKKASHAGKGPFGGENAELKNTALKGRDGCSMTRCMTDCNYPSPFYLAIRMRIRGSETHCWTGERRERRETRVFMGVKCLLHTVRMAELQRR